ncbi:hypothetical protein EG829_12235 [bacterium]|nr:hypothetical protein [bacterium]
MKALGSEADSAEAFDRAVVERARIETRFGYRNSLVDELNGRHTVRDPELFSLIRTSRLIHEASSGAFSVTLRPILDAWGFTPSASPRMLS